ncbi:hypothetical protein FN846DRAFT_370786 [Sphaerosporella brunnea]|uniref:Uncharacterized protein n=1 Tax=Sphaerosporella brunnea TaxID=1250544 RepID=A0A5J5EI27_9PEZI|nr:hypothetical protein FN846DRAFT_370786 [Sphaerosporella brunnea]
MQPQEFDECERSITKKKGLTVGRLGLVFRNLISTCYRKRRADAWRSNILLALGKKAKNGKNVTTHDGNWQTKAFLEFEVNVKGELLILTCPYRSLQIQCFQASWPCRGSNITWPQLRQPRRQHGLCRQQTQRHCLYPNAARRRMRRVPCSSPLKGGAWLFSYRRWLDSRVIKGFHAQDLNQPEALLVLRKQAAKGLAEVIVIQRTSPRRTHGAGIINYHRPSDGCGNLFRFVPTVVFRTKGWLFGTLRKKERKAPLIRIPVSANQKTHHLFPFPQLS